jgi:hypothetical protein
MAHMQAVAALGRHLAVLLDPETTVPGVTDPSPHPQLKGHCELAIADKSKSADLAHNARWGYPGQNGVTMPGTRGEGFLDIHLNATIRWEDVPEPVWTHTRGGYQALKKWLSYPSPIFSTAPSPATKPSNSPTTFAASPGFSNRIPLRVQFLPIGLDRLAAVIIGADRPAREAVPVHRLQ